MLKGLAITPPVIGRISIGRVVEKNGRRLPEKDDEFTLTSQVQGLEGWVKHPLDAALRKDAGTKLRSIPVRLPFGAPELNLRAHYTLFDRETGRPLCVGDGERCRRVTDQGIESLPCPTPAGCPLAQDGRCKPYGRLHVRVVTPEVETGAGEDDGLGTFVFRTTGFNSIRTLTARLAYLKAVSGGLLASLPLMLRLRGKSTTQSYRAPVYYVDVTTPPGTPLEQAVVQATAEDERRKQLGFDQWALDEAAREGYAAGAFEETEEEGGAVVEEFYPETAPEGEGDPRLPPPPKGSGGLQARLEGRLRRSNGGEPVPA
ncbi:MAG: hydrolase or metal-binding protein [Proteobacteria bacterium]|nr:hydrolase or metal-binding protein [Pseudomonadota bacterium]